MKRRDPIEKVRNIGIMAHIDAGKTTTTERILFYTGITHKMGEVDEGTAVMDWMAQEQERGITITSAATACRWRNCKINIIDTPGHVDFTVEVERSLRVLDGAIIILCGVGGVEAQSETVWRQADRYKIPRIVYINKMDRVGVNPERAIEQMKERFNIETLEVQMTAGREEDFQGVIDLINMKEINYGDDLLGVKYKVREIPQEYKEEAEKKRMDMLEKLSDIDDSIMEKYLEGRDVSPSEIVKAIRKGTLSLEIIPVLFGSSFKNKGVHPILDAVVDYLPSPADVPPVTGYHPKTKAVEQRKPLDDEPFSAFVFKVMNDPYAGMLAFFRVYSGKTKVGTSIYNCTREEEERVNRLLEMHSNKRKDIKEVFTGDIAALTSTKAISTGDTLSVRNRPIIFSSIEFPEPVVSAFIEPKSRSEHLKLSESLNKLAKEDPTFKIKKDPMTGQTLVYGMGELHLEILMERMAREFGVKANLGNPQVAYKETITQEAEGEGKYIRQSGGRGQYGHCKLRIEPSEEGKDFEFANETKGGLIPKEFIPPIEDGIKEAMEAGVLAGFSMTNIKAALIDGSFHQEDSTSIAFKIAGSLAFKEASKKSKPTLLEPIMSLEVLTPEEYLGDVVGDLNSRRAKIASMDSSGGTQTVRAFVPMSEMFGYATDLRTMTQGRGLFTMEFSEYKPTAPSVMEKIVARVEGKISY
ncbi:MAG TPA: elongation factor G [Acidobacteriota bacterium]|nr:elongation factor G [Acidobacteriota bacterium]